MIRSNSYEQLSYIVNASIIKKVVKSKSCEELYNENLPSVIDFPNLSLLETNNNLLETNNDLKKNLNRRVIKPICINKELNYYSFYNNKYNRRIYNRYIGAKFNLMF